MLPLNKPTRDLITIWIIWALLVIGFQAITVVRFQAEPPDTVLDWTEGETTPGAHDSQPYLLDPFLNQQVAYDSEFYISIAIAGYDDPSLRAIWLNPNVEPAPIWTSYPMPFGIPNDFPNGRPPGVPSTYKAYSLNHAFFPFYPLTIRLISAPLRIFDLTTIARATLAGVIVSLLGALGGMLALYDLVRDKLGESGAKKTAFYLIIFPTGFFLAMVHTEGLFVGLTFGALALLYRKHWLWASLLAACAAWTRAVGVALVIPFGIAWLAEAFPYAMLLWKRRQQEEPSALRLRWDLLWKGILGLSPLFAFGLWNLLLGEQFHVVEAGFFSRETLAIKHSLEAWRDTYHSLFRPRKLDTADWIGRGILALTALLVVLALFRRWLQKRLPSLVWNALKLGLLLFGAALIYAWFKNTANDQRSFYYMVEFSATILALVACAYTLPSMPGLSLFGLMVIAISFFSGVPQGMHRYILGVPAVFIMLGELGQNDDVFDRAWTIGSVLMMGLFAQLFAFNFWVG